MTNQWRGKSARPLGDFAISILDPVLKRKAGLSTALVPSREEIAARITPSKTARSRDMFGSAFPLMKIEPMPAV